MTLEELNNNVKSFNVIDELEKIIKDVEHEIIDLNTSQLYSGIKSTGESLGEYRPKTIEYKKVKGQPYDRVTLKDTGDFYSGFNVTLRNNNFEVDSKDEKTGKLTEIYTEEIFGLTKENMSDVTDEHLSPKLTNALNERIKGL